MRRAGTRILPGNAKHLQGREPPRQPLVQELLLVLANPTRRQVRDPPRQPLEQQRRSALPNGATRPGAGVSSSRIRQMVLSRRLSCGTKGQSQGLCQVSDAPWVLEWPVDTAQRCVDMIRKRNTTGLLVHEGRGR